MAHKKHHKRTYLGGLPIMGGSASVGTVYTGAVLSLVGNAIFNYLNNNFINSPASVAAGTPDGVVDKNVPLWLKPIFGPAIAAAVLYFGAKHGVKKFAPKAAGLAAGALTVGIASVVKGALSTYVSPIAPAYLNFAGAPVRVVGPQFSPSRVPGYTNFPGLSGRGLGEVIAAPSTRRSFGEVVAGPGFKGLGGRHGYADSAQLSGLAGWSQMVADREMQPV